MNKVLRNHSIEFISLLLVGLAAFIYRFLSASGYFQKADGVVIAMMADDIAKGVNFPLIYYGQFYMGSIEAWITAPLFMITGPTWWGIAFAPIFVSTIGVIPFYFLGKSLGGKASGMAAALLWAITPFAVNFYNISPRGCYPEVLCGGAALLWYATERFKGASFGSVPSFFIGALTGLLLWTSLLSVPAITVVALSVVWASRLKIFQRENIILAVGFAVGAAPFLAILSFVKGDTTTKIGFSNPWQRADAFFETLKSLFLPYPSMGPSTLLTFIGWASLFIMSVCLIMALILSITKRRSGSDIEWRNAIPLTVFTVVFLALYLLNESSLSQQSRYLLPIFIPLIVATAMMFARIWSNRKIVALILPMVVIVSAYFNNDFIFTNVKKQNIADRKLIENAVTRFSGLGLSSVIWVDYERAHQTTYEAMIRGVKLRCMDIEGSRSEVITYEVEKDLNTGVVITTAESEILNQLKSCCQDDYKLNKAAGAKVLSGMKPVRRPALSIPPEQWILPETLKALGDRRFSTTIASNKSFTVELKEPARITKIRAIIGGRQPQSTAIMVSVDGSNWLTAAKAVGPSLFVPAGPKVYTRAVLGYDREHQEWNFPPVEAKFIKFKIEHPEDKLFDIHELFIYKAAKEPVIDPSPKSVYEAAQNAAVNLLAANRWYAANLLFFENRKFNVIKPTLRPVDPVYSSSRIAIEPGLGVMVEMSDALELSDRLNKKKIEFSETKLSASQLFTITGGAGDGWWTGFTLIDW